MLQAHQICQGSAATPLCTDCLDDSSALMVPCSKENAMVFGADAFRYVTKIGDGAAGTRMSRDHCSGVAGGLMSRDLEVLRHGRYGDGSLQDVYYAL